MNSTDGRGADWIGVKKKKMFRSVKLCLKLFVRFRYSYHFINLKDIAFIFISSVYPILLAVLLLDVDKLIINA